MNPLTKTLLCLIATLPAAYSAPLILGDTTGNARGVDSIDIQTVRSGGPSNVTSGDFSISLGIESFTSGNESVSVGLYHSTGGNLNSNFGYSNWITSSAYESTALGTYNVVDGVPASFQGGIAVGYNNYVLYYTGGNGVAQYFSSANLSAAFGIFNEIGSGALRSIAIGGGNTITVSRATVFGANITNSIADSTMIGPSNTAKVMILSSGNVGIGLGNTSPVAKLDVGGDIRLSGNIIKAGGGTVVLPTSGTLTLPAGGGSLVTTNGAQTILGTTTLGGSVPTQQLKVDGTTGNVGVGTAPASAKLTVGGAAKVNGELEVGSGSSIDGDNIRLLADAVSSQWNIDNSSGDLRLFTETAPSVGTSVKAVFTSSGNMGLGTASPRSMLDVVRYHAVLSPTINVRAFSAGGTAGRPQLNFVKSHGSEAAPTDIGTISNERVGQIAFSGRYNSTEQNVVSLISYVDGLPAPGATGLPGIFMINVADGSGSTAQLSLNSQGNLSVPNAISIGNTTPATGTKLDVNGAVQIAGNVTIKNVGSTKSVIRISPAGDIDMGGFTSGTNPN